MRSPIFRYALLLLLLGCAQPTFTDDTPQDLDGFLRLRWGWASGIARDRMLAWAHVVPDTALTMNAPGVLVFRNVRFLGFQADRCSLIFFELGGLSDVQLRFRRPGSAAQGLFDSLRTSVQRAYGTGTSGDHRVEWVVQPIRRGYVRDRRVVLTLEPDGSLLLHAHADYAEIQHR